MPLKKESWEHHFASEHPYFHDDQDHRSCSNGRVSDEYKTPSKTKPWNRCVTRLSMSKIKREMEMNCMRSKVRAKVVLKELASNVE